MTLKISIEENEKALAVPDLFRGLQPDSADEIRRSLELPGAKTLFVRDGEEVIAVGVVRAAPDRVLDIYYFYISPNFRARADIAAACLAAAEAFGREIGCKFLRAETQRLGRAKQLIGQGFDLQNCVLRKAIK